MLTATPPTAPEDSPLFQFVYISHITSTGLSCSSTLNDIAKVSIKNNKIDHITGILCYGNGYFFQYIEGSEQALTNLKNSLLMDDRHKDMQPLAFSKIVKRRFTGWSLRYMTLERWMINDPKVKAFMPFKPDEWDADHWHQLIDILQSYHEIQERANNLDTPPIQYNTLGVSLSKVVGEHQAFFLIQTILGVLIIIALLWFML